MEKRDLYDLNRNLTGETIYKGEKYPKNRKILVVTIWIENSKGEFLIQKRKDNNKWATTGGHPQSGETSIEGIISEVKEELNLDISNKDIKFVCSSCDELVFVDLYYLKIDIDINKLKVQESEVLSIKWATLDEIRKLIEKNEFFNKHIDKYYQLLDYKGIQTLSY